MSNFMLGNYALVIRKKFWPFLIERLNSLVKFTSLSFGYRYFVPIFHQENYESMDKPAF